MKEIKAELITIGDEILYGHILNTNVQWMSQQMSLMGIQVLYHTTISDEAKAIFKALEVATQRADIVLITGGLGPTKDDITKKVIAQFYDSEMALNEEAFENLKRLFASRNRTLTDLNRQQAELPVKCTYLPNRVGTAPGMWFQDERAIVVSMPGVPYEMKTLVTEQVIPRLKEHFTFPVIIHKTVKTVGIPESVLAKKIEDWENELPLHIKLAYLPSYGEVKLRLTGTGTQSDSTEIVAAIDSQIQQLLPFIEEAVFGYDDMLLPVAIGRLLEQKNQMVAIAESCTGGFISQYITAQSGCSAYFAGSIVAYQNELKQKLLNVKADTLKAHGAVSAETVKEMASGVRKACGTAIGLSTSGIAGPTGGTTQKPVGTVWIGYSDDSQTFAHKLQLTQDRNINIRLTATYALNLMRLAMQGLWRVQPEM